MNINSTHLSSIETNYRWERTDESKDFFDEADRFKRNFIILVFLSSGLLTALCWGLYRLHTAALRPPKVIGISHGLLFSAEPQFLSSVEEKDLDLQLSDTIEVLFGRTEKGLPQAIKEFCAPEVIASVERDYHDSRQKYPAGFVQTLSISGFKRGVNTPGIRHMRYSGVLTSRSLLKAQMSVIYVDVTFAITAPTHLNVSGWKLVRLEGINRSDYYKDEHTAAVLRALNSDSK
jgi:hypothetical protein